MPIREDLQNLLNIYAAAYQAGDAKACAAMFAPNGELYSPYAPPARGRTTIEELHKDWTQDGGNGKQLNVIHAGSSGGMAWCLASFCGWHVTGDGTSLTGAWLRRRQYQLRVCSLNSNDPEQAGSA